MIHLDTTHMIHLEDDFPNSNPTFSGSMWLSSRAYCLELRTVDGSSPLSMSRNYGPDWTRNLRHEAATTGAGQNS